MTWYSIHKIFRGGRYPRKGVDYIEVPNGTSQDVVQEVAEEWAEGTSGGHNYGYTVYWRRAKKPSNKWLIKEIDKNLISEYEYQLSHLLSLLK